MNDEYREKVDEALSDQEVIAKAQALPPAYLIAHLTAERDKAREEVGLWKWRAELYAQERDNFIRKYKEARNG